MLTLDELQKMHDKAYLQNQQTRENAADDLVFYAVTQWDDQLLNGSQLQYRGEFNIIRKAGRQIMAELNANPVQVDFEPRDEEREDGGELLDGIYRSVDRENTSQDAYENAKNEMIICGVGAWKLYTKYETLRDGSRDQVIKRDPIYEANNKVFWDPNAHLLDKSDATYCSVLQSFTPEGYRQLVKELTGDDPGEISPTNFGTPEDSYTFVWFDGNRHIYVSEFYYKEKIKDRLLFMVDPMGQELVLRESDLADVMDEMIDTGYVIADEKEIERFVVTKYIASGEEILSAERIAGESIPIVPCYGERFIVEDNEIWQGITRLAKDPQRLRNFQLSYLTDLVSRSPRNKPIFLPEQIQGFEFMYEETGSDNNYPYYLQNKKTPTGEELPIGPAGVMPDQNVPQALAASIAESRQAVDDVTTPGIPQDVADTDISGKAVMAIQNRIDMQSMVYQDHMKHAKRRDGEIFAQMAAEIYDAPRKVRVTRPDGRSMTVEMYQGVIDSETGEPKILNDLRNAEFNVFSKIGPTYSTQKQQSREEIVQLMSMMGPNDPTRNILMMMYTNMLDGEDFKDLRKYSRRQLLMQGIVEPESEEEMMMLQQLSQREDQPDPMMMAAMAEMEKAKADQMREQRESVKDQVDAQYKMGKNEIDLYKAETDRMEAMIDAQETGANIRNTEADTVSKSIDNAQKQVSGLRATLQ